MSKRRVMIAIVVGMLLVGVGITRYIIPALFPPDTPTLQTWNIGNPVLAIAFSPDGQSLALAQRFLPQASQLRRVMDGKLVATWNVGETIALSSHGNIMSAVRDGDVVVGQIVTPYSFQVLRSTPLGVGQGTLVFSTDGKLLAGAGISATQVWRVVDGQPLLTLQRNVEQLGNAIGLAFNPDSKILATSNNRAIQLWAMNTGELLRTLNTYTETGFIEGFGGFDSHSIDYEAVNTISFSPDGQLLAAGNGSAYAGDSYINGSEDHEVRIWRTTDYQLIRTLREPQYGVNTLAFSPNGQLIAAAGGRLDGATATALSYPDADTVIRIWRVNDGQLMTTLRGHKNMVWSLAWSPDGHTLASGSEDGTVRVWDIK